MLRQDDPVDFSPTEQSFTSTEKLDHRVGRKRQFKTRCLQKVTATALEDQTFNG